MSSQLGKRCGMMILLKKKAAGRIRDMAGYPGSPALGRGPQAPSCTPRGAADMLRFQEQFGFHKSQYLSSIFIFGNLHVSKFRVTSLSLSLSVSLCLLLCLSLSLSLTLCLSHSPPSFVLSLFLQALVDKGCNHFRSPSPFTLNQDTLEVQTAHLPLVQEGLVLHS